MRKSLLTTALATLALNQHQQQSRQQKSSHEPRDGRAPHEQPQPSHVMSRAKWEQQQKQQQK